MHVFDETDGPAVDLRLPLDVARRVRDLCRHAIPSMTGLDGTVVDEINAQLCDQVDQGTGELIGRLPKGSAAPRATDYANLVGKYVRIEQGEGEDCEGGSGLLESVWDTPDGVALMWDYGMGHLIRPGEVLRSRIYVARGELVGETPERIERVWGTGQGVLDQQQADRDEQDAMHSAAMAEAEAAGERP